MSVKKFLDNTGLGLLWDRITELLAAKANTSDIPTKVSDLQNDSGYLTQHQDISGKVDKVTGKGLSTNDFTDAYKDKLDSALTSYAETDPTVPSWAKQAQKPTYTAQEVGALPADTVIPTVPTNVSAFTNDAGYLTEHQDISGKANVVDLAAVATSGSYNDLSNKPFIPSAVSDLTDDSGHYTKPAGGIPASDLANGVLDVWSGLTYHTSTMSTDSDSFVLGGATDAPTEINKCLVTSTPDANVIPKFDYQGRLHSVTPEEEWDGSNTVATTEYVDTMISNNMPEVPTNISELNNDAGYLTSYTETDPTVPSWAKAAQKPSYTAAEVGAPTVQEMNSAISSAIGNINSFDMAVVQELPTQDISTHTIYLVPKTGETNDVYDEYVYINNAWEMIGNTQIDLSNYATKGELPTVPVTDIQINGTSVVVNGIANFPLAALNTTGLAKIGSGAGITVNSNGELTTNRANNATIKEGIETARVIVPNNQHVSVFYGLAKAASDTTQSQSDNAVGTYTTEAKAAIRTMIGAAASADIPSVPVQDVQVNGTSVLNNDVANIPVASTSTMGVVKLDDNYGVGIDSNGALKIKPATGATTKAGVNIANPIIPGYQHYSAFYGLAKAAGDSTQSSSSNAVGIYTDAAKQAIQNMLGITSLLSTEEASTATAAHAANSLFLMGGKLHKATSAIAIGDAVEAGTNCEVVKADEVFVKWTDTAGTSKAGIVGPTPIWSGVTFGSDGSLYLNEPNDSLIQQGTDNSRTTLINKQHAATFYGLAKAAGADLKDAQNITVGTYPTTAATAIKTMLQVQEGLEVVRLI